MIKILLKLLLSCTVILVSCSCGLLNPNNDATPLWKTQIFSGALALLEMNPHIWNGHTLFLGEQAGRSTLFLINQSTGQVRWQWDDFLQTKEEVAGEDEQYLFDSKFCFQTLGGVYLLDMINGKTEVPPFFWTGSIDNICAILVKKNGEHHGKKTHPS